MKNKVASFRKKWKKLYDDSKMVRAIHIILQYIIIIVFLPLFMMAILYLLDYLWQERPGLLFVAIPGTYLSICSVWYFLKDKKIRKSLEEKGKLPKETKKTIIHDMIVIAELFAAYILIKCLLKWVFS